MPLLNYTTKVPPERTVSEIMTVLTKRGVTEISTTYGANGSPSGLRWTVDTRHGPLSFSLPVNIDKVYQLMTKERFMVTNPQARMDQACRTSWRIIKTWVEAQMALLDTDMVELEEIFLPYMLEGDRTRYQVLDSQKFQKALPAGTGSG